MFWSLAGPVTSVHTSKAFAAVGAEVNTNAHVGESVEPPELYYFNNTQRGRSPFLRRCARRA